MENRNYFSIWEVEYQSNVERVHINDDKIDYGYDPQCNLELKEPGRFSLNSLVGRLHGKMALHQFKKGDLVAVSLIYTKVKSHHEYITRITIEDIKIVKNVNDIYIYE